MHYQNPGYFTNHGAKQQSSLRVDAQPFIKDSNNSAHGINAKAQISQINKMPVIQQISPFLSKTNSQMQFASNKFKELNEKNLYLFDKQQSELFDKQKHWNQIFLPEQRATTDSGQGLITSQSVFCFPMGLQEDEKADQATTPKKDYNELYQSEKKQLRNSIGNALADTPDPMIFNVQKRNSMHAYPKEQPQMHISES